MCVIVLYFAALARLKSNMITWHAAIFSYDKKEHTSLVCVRVHDGILKREKCF